MGTISNKKMLANQKVNLNTEFWEKYATNNFVVLLAKRIHSIQGGRCVHCACNDIDLNIFNAYNASSEYFSTLQAMIAETFLRRATPSLKLKALA